jgi:hypothetical protein
MTASLRSLGAWWASAFREFYAFWRYAPSDHVVLYFEPRDWWVGYYRGDSHHYVCLLPTVVIRWPRRLTTHPCPPSDTGGTETIGAP